MDVKGKRKLEDLVRQELQGQRSRKFSRYWKETTGDGRRAVGAKSAFRSPQETSWRYHMALPKDDSNVGGLVNFVYAHVEDGRRVGVCPLALKAWRAAGQAGGLQGEVEVDGMPILLPPEGQDTPRQHELRSGWNRR